MRTAQSNAVNARDPKIAMPWRPRSSRKAAYSIPAYSPRGESDDRPNVLDARYTLTNNDAPVDLPLASSRPLYFISGVLILALIGMVVGVFAARSSSASDLKPPATEQR